MNLILRWINYTWWRMRAYMHNAVAALPYITSQKLKKELKAKFYIEKIKFKLLRHWKPLYKCIVGFLRTPLWCRSVWEIGGTTAFWQVFRWFLRIYSGRGIAVRTVSWSEYSGCLVVHCSSWCYSGTVLFGPFRLA